MAARRRGGIDSVQFIVQIGEKFGKSRIRWIEFGRQKIIKPLVFKTIDDKGKRGNIR
jgi:hypothetical protein